MKITVITGSPRKHGNSFAMTDAFIREAETLGHTVRRFDAALMKIGGCRACQTCFKTGKACSFDDDFNLIAPAIMEADAVVFTMPTYWYSIPAQIKGGGRKGYRRKEMRTDSLLRRKRRDGNGRHPYAAGTFCRSAEMGDGWRSAYYRSIERR